MEPEVKRACECCGENFDRRILRYSEGNLADGQIDDDADINNYGGMRCCTDCIKFINHSTHPHQYNYEGRTACYSSYSPPSSPRHFSTVKQVRSDEYRQNTESELLKRVLFAPSTKSHSRSFQVALNKLM